MTLQEFCTKNKISPPRHGDFFCVPTGLQNEADLWYLTDYRVSSVTGGVVWLAPIIKKAAQ